MALSIIPNPPTEDIMTIALDDAVWSFAADDGIPKERWTPCAGLWYGCYSGTQIAGTIYVSMTTSICASIHVAFNRTFRGVGVCNCIARFVDNIGLWTDRKIAKVIAEIPSANTNAVRLAGALGFRVEGILTKSIVQRGTIGDITIMGREIQCS